MRILSITLLAQAAAFLSLLALHASEPEPPAPKRIKLFDGQTFDGWEGDVKATWRIEEGAIVAGSLEAVVPRNEFLAATREFADFDLQLQYKLIGTEGFVNGGVQFRTERIPDDHEVRGYQADFGAGYDGALYDESRRNRVLSQPPAELVKKLAKPNDWNVYRIRCEGPHIQLWLNGMKTVDYVEDDDAIRRDGIIALQIHGDAKAVVSYREIEIAVLNTSDNK